MFNALMARKDADAQTIQLQSINDSDLPTSGVDIDVDYSTINYKDALAVTAASPIIRSYPLIPGIDLAGTVTASDDNRWKVGDRVLVNGYGLGERHNGGLTQKARVAGDFLVSIPEGITSRQAMAIGTAGITAMLSVLALHENPPPTRYFGTWVRIFLLSPTNEQAA